MGVTTVSTHPRWRIERTAPGESAAQWHLALSNFNPADASPLKEERGDATMLARLAGRDVILKRWSLPSLWDRLKHIARAGRAWRQWRGAELLHASGIPAARGLVIASDDTSACLIMELVLGRNLLEHLAGVAGGELSPRQQHAVARAIAAMLTHLEASGLHNRDGKPSNLLLSGFDPAGHPKLVVIDTVGVRARFPANGTITMLKNLCMEPLGHRCLPRRALMARVVACLGDREPCADAVRQREQRRATWQAVAAAVKAHGDPTPRVDILSVARQSGQARAMPRAPSENTR